MFLDFLRYFTRVKSGNTAYAEDGTEYREICCHNRKTASIKNEVATIKKISTGVSAIDEAYASIIGGFTAPSSILPLYGGIKGVSLP